MEIIVGKTAGFCFGVKNAVSKSKKELEKQGKIYCLGELVHNKTVTDDLEKQGMIFIENIKEGKNEVIIRAHGIQKSVYYEAKKLGIELIDLTCPKVLMIHNIIEDYNKKNYFVFLVGKEDHPEVQGSVSFADNFSIIENEDDIKKCIEDFKKSGKEKSLLIAQTTYSLEKYEYIAKIIKDILKDQIEIKNTICLATKERQEETKKIASEVDKMIIVGGKHSSNSNKLNEIASKYCKEVFFIEDDDELDIKRINVNDKIGIMAGASTPYESIEKVIEKINKMC